MAILYGHIGQELKALRKELRIKNLFKSTTKLVSFPELREDDRNIKHCIIVKNFFNLQSSSNSFINYL